MINDIENLSTLYEGIILLEKDHRQSMMKFGIPQDVADYLHNYNDKYSLWFANQFKTMPDYQRATDKVAWIRGTKQFHMANILDWIANVPNTMLKAYNWQEAVDAAANWHNSLQSTNLKDIEDNTILKTYNDGFYWVDLESRRCTDEGAAMGHCGTTHKAQTIYSLRKFDKNTQTRESFITMAISPSEGVWYQCKGKKNSKPKPEYYPYIVDILIMKKCYKYQSEYNGQNDFRPDDFKKYLEDRPDLFADQRDDILSKLEEQGLEVQAAKIFKKYDFENINVNYEIEEGGEDTEFIWSTGYANITITSIEMPELLYLTYKTQKKNKWGGTEFDKELVEIIRNTLDHFSIYLEQDWMYSEPFRTEIEGNLFTLIIQVNMSNRDEQYYGEELYNFDSFLNNMKDVDRTMGKEDFHQDFIDYFTEQLDKIGWLADESLPNNKRPRLDHPAQMKFPFGEALRHRSFKSFANRI